MRVSTPDPDNEALDRLMSRIRMELFEQNPAGGSVLSGSRVSTPGTISDVTAAVPPEGEAIPVGVYLSKHDEEFVRFLYAAVLRRAADSQGLAHHLSLLRRRRLSRVAMLDLFTRMPEARATSLVIPGLRRHVMVDRLKRLSGMRTIAGVLRGARLLRELPEIDAALGRVEKRAEAASASSVAAVDSATRLTRAVESGMRQQRAVGPLQDEVRTLRQHLSALGERVSAVEQLVARQSHGVER